jgi:hypothetical protein
VTNTDETGYLYQAQMMLRGTFTWTKVDAITGTTLSEPPTTYPPGTALRMAPWIALFGWRGGFAVSALSLVLAILVTARWLRDENRSALFALVILGFAPSMVMGRLAMSDVTQHGNRRAGLVAMATRSTTCTRDATTIPPSVASASDCCSTVSAC